MTKDVTARTSISGIVNGHSMKGEVVATFEPGRGGRSSCQFSQLPPSFTPATFGNLT
jgi:hypothetical protein